MPTSVEMIAPYQDEISLMADALIGKGVVGSKQVAGDLHPAWQLTAELPNFMCRCVAIQLAENRYAVVAKAA